jgi:hypothetical protein
MIVPLFVTGILFGHMFRTKKERIGWRLAVSGSLLGGLGNAANAAVLYLFPDQTSTGSAIRASARQVVTTQTTLSFLLLSFVAGALIVALVIISAVLTQKRTFPRLPFRKGEENSLE